MILPSVADSGLSLAGAGCVSQDLDCRGTVLLLVYKVLVHMVVMYKVVDMLVVYMVLCLDGGRAGLLMVFAGILE